MRKSSGYTRCWLELHSLWLSRKPDHIRYSSQPRFHMIFNTKVTWIQNQITSRRDKCCQFHQESKTTKKEPWQPQTLVLTRKHFLISTPLCSYVTILKRLIPFLQTKLLDFFVEISLITPLWIVQIVRFSTRCGIMNHFMFYRDCTFIRNTLANKLNKNDSDIRRGTSESNVSCSISSW